jgi:hypothetical protein
MVLTWFSAVLTARDAAAGRLGRRFHHCSEADVVAADGDRHQRGLAAEGGQLARYAALLVAAPVAGHRDVEAGWLALAHSAE